MILVTGGTGLIGQQFLELIDKDMSIANEQVICLVRETSDLSYIEDKGFQHVVGDITDKERLLQVSKGVDSIVHIVQMRYSPTIIDVANTRSVSKLLIIGTTGVFSDYPKYSDEYKVAEEYIEKNCRVPYIIFRPTMIYGEKNDKNMNKLIRFIDRFGFFPVFGKGEGLMQPIYYKDISKVLYTALNRDSLPSKGYNIAGKTRHEYQELLRIVGEQLGKKVHVIKIPYRLSTALVGGYNKVSKNPKLKLEQLRRLREDKVFDYEPAATEYDFDPIGFQEGIKHQIKSMYRNKGET
ncbi:NAD-dependent epimerase/dehydratase family protein [Shouchella shacheensis]|uniref:NAD-dependent epimerase/dehydratase family protein n=1 Tax=Shouchella shacheensis TaxID=1649580 RepID=UPI00073FE25B|nr:SDR family oxidoreductase [Shouchella shacheensis]